MLKSLSYGPHREQWQTSHFWLLFLVPRLSLVVGAAWEVVSARAFTSFTGFLLLHGSFLLLPWSFLLHVARWQILSAV